MSDTSSEVLVRRARERDADAIAELYERYRVRLRRALRRMLGDGYRRTLLDSEDAVQDGILAALGQLDRFEYRGSGSFLAWVLRIAECEVLQRLRAQRAQRRDRDRQTPLEDAGDPTAPGATPSQVAAGHETEERIRDCLEKLEERERTVIVLRRYLEMNAEQIAEEMELPTPGAARALLSRAQARLAALLDRTENR